VVVAAGLGVVVDGLLVFSLVLELSGQVVRGRAVAGLANNVRRLRELTLLVGKMIIASSQN
jgi:hypothetical protein